MRNTIKAALFAVPLALSIFGAAGAHADPANGAFSGPQGDRNAEAFWSDIVQYFSDGGSVADAAKLGPTLCYNLEQGAPEGEIAADVAHQDSNQLDAATYIVHAAEWHYCPDKY